MGKNVPENYKYGHFLQKWSNRFLNKRSHKIDTEYRNVKTLFEVLKRQSKKSCYSRFMKKCKSDLKILEGYWKEVIGKSSKNEYLTKSYCLKI